MIYTSRYNFWDQGIILLRQEVTKFSHFFRARMIFGGISCWQSSILWKTTSCYVMFLLDLLVYAQTCFKKYWTMVHFKREAHTYVVHLDSLNRDKITLKKDLDTFYWNLNYEERFEPIEVKPSLQRKWFIDTHYIMGATNSLRGL